MNLTRLTAPNGATVNVSPERAKVLRTQGYTEASEKKAPAKKSASSKSEK